MARRSPLPPYLAWRDGRPRWVPGPKLRPHFKGQDLKDERGAWLGLEAAITAARSLNDEVAAWKAGGSPKRRQRAPKVTRSCRALWQLYTATPEFRRLAATTRADYEIKARVWLEAFGDAPVAALGRAALKGFWRELHDTRGHPMANGVLAVARAALTFATDEEWIEANPAFKLKLPTVAARVAFWSPAKVAAIVATADKIGLHSIGDAVIVALHSGQRQGDVLAMPARIFDDRIRLTQCKRGALVDAPITPALAERVAAIRSRWRARNILALETLIADERTGRAYADRHAFHKSFATVREAAAARHPDLCKAERMQPGLRELHFQDLRDTAVTRLATSGCSLPEIAAITGHSPDHITSVIKHYLALNDSMADQAIGKLVTWMTRQGIAL